jgi:hypothetical protein
MTMTLISTVTVGSGGSTSINFTSIPQTFTDLLVVHSIRKDNTSGSFIGLTLNASSANFTYRFLRGDGSATASFSGTVGLAGVNSLSDSTANTFASGSCYLPNYAGATNKSFSVDSVGENNSASALQTIWTGLWSNTAAITSLSLVTTAGNMVQNSTASLYGITKGSGGATVS